MREELKAVMQEVRRNEALIEYMELRGILPEPMRSIRRCNKEHYSKDGNEWRPTCIT